MAKPKLSKRQNCKCFQMFGSGFWCRSVRHHVREDICAHLGVSSTARSTRSVIGNKEEELDILEDYSVEVG